ncbi:MAG: hypothetical protein IJR53_04150, partial [Bacteroidales bacterium]|nr:hypothetical protein [Bacteroidales bacterium]
LRRINISAQANNLLWLKMRPDTPQLYEYITVEDIKGPVKNFILVAPWTQFYDLKGRKDSPMSYSDHITMRRCDVDCDVFFNVKQQENVYHLQTSPSRTSPQKQRTMSFTRNLSKVSTTRT